MPNRRHIKAQIKHVRQILLKHWDPLLVRDNSQITDEYDSFLGRIMKCDPTKFEESLAGIEDELTIGTDQKKRSTTANELRKLGPLHGG